jgi:hypothetical protein
MQDAGEKAKQMMEASAEGTFMQIVDGRFRDDRWTADGRWDLSQFKDSKGEVDWDAVSILHSFLLCQRLQSQTRSSRAASYNQRLVTDEHASVPAAGLFHEMTAITSLGLLKLPSLSLQGHSSFSSPTTL